MTPPDRGPWGPWATLGLAVVVGLAFVVMQTTAALVYAWTGGDGRPAHLLVADGDFIATASLASAPVCVMLIVALVWLRRGGPSAREYLALTPARPRAFALWVTVAFAVVMALDEVTRLLGRDAVPEYMLDAYTSADAPVLFWLAMVVAAPVWEEMFFRGFLLTGLERSRLGPAGAIVVTSLVFGVVHRQYDPVQQAMVLTLGATLALARLRTGSLWVPMAMHAFINLLATAQAAAAAA